MNKIKRALISISNKKNLRALLVALKRYNIDILSTGGTFKEIKKLKFQATEVSEFTSSPEILSGRVKTLHPKIYGGILNKRNNKSDLRDIKNHDIQDIDLVIVNFYPFENVVKKKIKHQDIIENIDIGGPTLVRAAAKNYKDVTVITSFDHYNELINELKNNNGSTSLEFRKKMSQEAFSETAYYDSFIANYFNKINLNYLPKKKIIHSKLIKKLRYGENPHQRSAIYSFDGSLNLNQIHGKQLSYNNYSDIFAALQISKTFPDNKGTVIVKHGNPCGASININNTESFLTAYKCDPISSFGGIVSCNFKINRNLALKLNKLFFEVIIGDDFDKDALSILKRKKNVRLIKSKNYRTSNKINLISDIEIALAQQPDIKKFNISNFKIVSKAKPNKKTFENLIFAFNFCKFVKSNAIVLTTEKSTIGIGSGQPSRLDSCDIAIKKMNKFQDITNKEILAASDAFFPFVDGIEKLVQSGVSAIIQPSGSIRDKEIIDFANKTGTILVFSKTRHFKH